MKNARIYDFAIGANGSFQLNVEGEYVRIMSSTGNLELSTDAYRIGPISAGQGQAKTPFKRLTVNDKSGALNVGTILIGSSDFVDQRITGTVDVLDSTKTRTKGLSAYGAASSMAAIAANFTFSYLYNPAGSGVNVVVNDLTVGSSTAQTLYVCTGGGVPPGSINGATSKMANSGAVSACKKYDGSQAAFPTSNVIFAPSAQANQAANVRLTEPIVLPPNTWLCVTCTSANTDLQVSRQLFEEPV